MYRSFRKRDATPLVIACLMLAAGCATERLAPAALPPGEAAIVRADPVVSAGLPVQVRLRQVDGRHLPASASAVELAPGAHSLLVDCRVAETESVRRFRIEAQVVAGARYRLVATATARNCEAVELAEQ